MKGRSAVVVLVGSVAALASCVEPAPVRLCGKAARALVMTPATFRIAEFSTTERAGFTAAVLLFDAQNQYGALVRERAECHFSSNQDRNTLTLTTFFLNGREASSSEVAQLNAVLSR